MKRGGPLRYRTHEIDRHLVENCTNFLKGQTEPRMRMLITAIAVLRYFLHNKFVDDRFYGKDDFYRLARTEELDKFRYIDRMCYLAHYLFLLRDADGFDTILERIKTRESRAPYYETMIAAFHRIASYDIFVSVESVTKGSDFDFRGEKDQAAIAVEVTALTNEAFSQQNISNVLAHKRSQMPPALPGSLYCILPDKWFEQGPNPLPDIIAVTNAFFRRSKRINYVTYVWGSSAMTDDVILFHVGAFPMEHPSPRHSTNLRRVGLDQRASVIIPNNSLRDAFPGHFSFMKILNAIP